MFLVGKCNVSLFFRSERLVLSELSVASKVIDFYGLFEAVFAIALGQIVFYSYYGIISEKLIIQSSCTSFVSIF